MNIADADYPDLLRDPNPGFENGLHGAGGGGIVITENGVGTRFKREQPARRFVARSIIGGVDYVSVRRLNSGRGQGFLITAQAAESGGDGRPGDMRDLPAAAFDQVRGGETPDGGIVGPHMR